LENDADVAISDSTIVDNDAEHGGGFYNFRATVTVINSTISGNTATNSGGAISSFEAAPFELEQSTFSGNTASNGNGGGIHVSGTFLLTNSTISGNTAVSGGGILLAAPAQSVGTLLTQEIDRDGNVTADAAWGDYGIEVGFVDTITEHGIAEPFWEFMQPEELVYEDGTLNEEALFENPFYATDRPITEAYWTTVPVAGEPRDVLLQCFEPRCLTRTPGNDPGFVVEAGNVGQHYFTWRYVQQPD
jgi:predicted outer membrane repeat protein